MKGNNRAPSAVAWPPSLSAARRPPGSKVPWLGFAAPHSQRLTPWVPRKCVRDVGSLALSSPAETCAGGWGLILRVWVPAHSLNSGEAAPEARPAGGALRARLIGESTASSVASLLGRRGGSRAQSRGKPCLHGAKWASSTAELQLCSEPRSGRVPGARLLCLGLALPRLALLLGCLSRKEQAAGAWESPLAPFLPQLQSCLAFAHRCQASLGRA